MRIIIETLLRLDELLVHSWGFEDATKGLQFCHEVLILVPKPVNGNIFTTNLNL
jgi:hypothetical protein